MRKFLCGCLGVAALTASPLFAEEEGDLFTKLDANKDGSVTADEVPEEAKSKFERLLRTGDKDSDGKLSKDEFAAGLKPDDAPKPPLAGGAGEGRRGGGQFNPREAFERMDANKDGKVSKDEAQGPFAQNFAAIDGNSDGFVTTEELAEGLRKLGGSGRPQVNPKEAEAVFNRWDANSDGKLTKEEFPEDRREAFARISERLGVDSIDKEQFTKVAGFLAQQGQPRPQGDRPPEGRPGEGRPGFGGPMGPGPLLRALDADNDGEISGGEIEAASKSLLTLDRNSDGKLTREEIGPPPSPEGRRGEGRPEGRPGANPIAMFDKDDDGKLSKEEAPERMKENFDRLDANSDGFVDATELRQAFQRGGGRPGEGRRPEGDRPREGGDRPREERKPE